jgi:cytochrome P450
MTHDDLPSLDPRVAERWATDLVGAAHDLFDADVHGLVRLGPEMVAAFRHADVRALTVAGDSGNTPADVLMRRAGDRGAVVDPTGGFFPIVSNQVFSYNPPLHPPARRILTRQMTPRNVTRFRPLADRLIDDLLADLTDRASFDLCADFAQRLAARFWGALIGLDSDECDEVQALTEVLATVFLLAPTPAQADALDGAVRRYMHVVTTAVQRSMGERDTSCIEPLGLEMLDEMAADLAALDVEGAPSSVGLLAAGNFFEGFHTMGVGLANAACLLLSTSTAYDRVRADRTLAASAYDEGTRLAPPLTLTHRYALGDIRHNDEIIPAGTMIAMHWAAANMDPAVFDDPLEFHLDRSTRGLLTFGGGPHLCPGRNISRLVGEMALASLVDQPATLSVGEEGPQWMAGASAAQLRSCRLTQTR